MLWGTSLTQKTWIIASISHQFPVISTVTTLIYAAVHVRHPSVWGGINQYITTVKTLTDKWFAIMHSSHNKIMVSSTSVHFPSPALWTVIWIFNRVGLLLFIIICTCKTVFFLQKHKPKYKYSSDNFWLQRFYWCSAWKDNLFNMSIIGNMIVSVWPTISRIHRLTYPKGVHSFRHFPYANSFVTCPCIY